MGLILKLLVLPVLGVLVGIYLLGMGLYTKDGECIFFGMVLIVVCGTIAGILTIDD